MTRAEMNWKIIRSILPLIALAAFVYFTQSKHIDYVNINPIEKIDADELIWRFQVNEGKEFIDQIIQIKGTVTGFDSTLIILNHRIICLLEPGNFIDIESGLPLTVKGRCIGYNDLLEEIRLDHVIKISEDKN